MYTGRALPSGDWGIIINLEGPFQVVSKKNTSKEF